MNKKNLLISALLLTYSVCSFADDAAVSATPVVTVNGVTITDAEVKHFMSKLQNKVPAERVLQEIINVELLAQAAKTQGMLNDENLMLEIKRTNTGLIASHYLQQQLLKMDISMDILKARYQKEYVDGEKGKEYNANHILVKTEAEAIDIIKQLDEGAIFIDLAKSLSTGPSGKNGGALGWFKPADMVAPFSQAAIALEPGKYTDVPVKTQFGWHVIILNDIRDIEPPSFESVSKQLSTTLASEEIQRIMKELHDSATIEFNSK